MKRLLSAALLLISAASALPGAVRLPAILSDHMVLQQDAEVAFWGWAETNEKVTVTPSWSGEPVEAMGDTMGSWQVTLKTPTSGGPHTITVKGYNEVVVEDVLVGETWLCSGQSNMAWSPSAGIDNAAEIVAAAKYPQIRFFSVARIAAEYPQLDVKGEWVVCTPETANQFSAIGYIFGRELHEALDVPVGLINSSWGGTPAEAWTPRAYIAEDPLLRASAATIKPQPWATQEPGRIYNMMISPLAPFRIAGAIWYQGESNVGRDKAYPRLLATMVNGWRARFANDFPFYYIQIANWEYGDRGSGAAIRDAQRRALALIPDSGMITITDHGNPSDIHPRAKEPVGERIAALALARSYGIGEAVQTGPLFKTATRDGQSVVVHFEQAAGLHTRDGLPPRDFQLAGADGVYQPATATIEGQSVRVNAAGLSDPRKIRFAWSDTLDTALMNGADIPASTFEADVETQE